MGDSSASASDYFVPARMLAPHQSTDALYYTPFVLGPGGTSITMNLGNALPTTSPDFTPSEDKLGSLFLVAFPDGHIDTAHAVKLTEIPYQDPGLITQQAGFFTATGFAMDYSTTPLGILSEAPSAAGGAAVGKLIATEHPQGYYLRADQFVYRMNPGAPTGPENPRGSTATVQIHVVQWGQPVPAGVEVVMNLMLPNAAQNYTRNTLGTSGTIGIDCVSVPQDVLSINGDKVSDPGTELIVTVATDVHGVASFDLVSGAPGNPRDYIDGQIYLLEYTFADPTLRAGFVQDVNDKISVLVYDEIVDMAGPDILAKWGRLYKIMEFLTDTQKISEISFRNMIKLMLEKPFSQVQHMPLTRDLSDAGRAKVIAWINALNRR